jgi:hypothetical protein
MILYRHHHSSFTEEYAVQQDNVIACLKFFKARFLQTSRLVQQPMDYL